MPGFRSSVAALLALPLLAWPTYGARADGLDPDPGLQRSLERVVERQKLTECARDQRLSLSLVDVTDAKHLRYAGVNDRVMMYAASLPKIAVLVAGFEMIRTGMLQYSTDVKEMFVRLTRFSSNVDASRAIHMIGFDNIAKVLTSPKYLFYDPTQNGGLWLGKAYGGAGDYWQRDPLHNLSHGATSYQVARFFLMLEQGKLVDQRSSAEIKEILSKPGIHHKFVKGLETMPGVEIYRKSGTWSKWHADAALVEHNGKKYIAVALMEDPRGGEVLPRLIRDFDQLICAGAGESGGD